MTVFLAWFCLTYLASCSWHGIHGVKPTTTSPPEPMDLNIFMQLQEDSEYMDHGGAVVHVLRKELPLHR
jgi:hypothetical protein